MITVEKKYSNPPPDFDTFAKSHFKESFVSKLLQQLFSKSESIVPRATIILRQKKVFFLTEDYGFVADSGMFNKDNLKALEDEGYNYTVGARLRNMSNGLKSRILNRELYKRQSEGYEIGEFEHTPGKRLIVSYKEGRAHKGANDRLKAISSLKEKFDKNMNQKSYLSYYGYKKYLKIEGDSKILLDEPRISQDSEWDGLHGVITNMKHAAPSDILSDYANLWTVEESFRITKHYLKVRPMFHWTPVRVQAYIAIVFTAYSLVRYMEYIVRLQYKKLSQEKMRNLLIKVQISILYDTRKKIRFGLPSCIEHYAGKIYAIFKQEPMLKPYIIQK